MPLILAALYFLLCAAAPARSAAESPTQPDTLSNQYQGGYKDDYPQVRVRVQSYLLPVQSEIAIELGLQYGQGFSHPVTVLFEDGRPANSENPFFFIRTKGSGDSFSQELVANVEGYAKGRDELARKEENLRGGFRYAIAKVMLNDLSAGNEESALPLWVQEGLAVYASGAGEHLVQIVAARTAKSRAGDLVDEVNNPGPFLTPRAWAGYYLAIKYIFAQGGVAAVQAFVRNVTEGKSPSDAIQNTLSQEWPAFTADLREFSANSYSQYTPEDTDAALSTHLSPRKQQR